jgi:hypothetical protein
MNRPLGETFYNETLARAELAMLHLIAGYFIYLRLRLLPLIRAGINRDLVPEGP